VILIDNKNLNETLAAWGLSNPQMLKQTMTSQIYTVTYGTEIAILKLLSPSETEEKRGAAALRYFDGHGAVRLLRSDDCAQLMEYAPGDELVTLVESGQDEEATRVIPQVIQQLHGVPQDRPIDGLVRLDDWFGALFRQGAADRRTGRESIYVRGAALAESLLADPQDVRVLHGDIQHYNIRQSARGWLAFDPKGLVGERTYDCANTLCNPVMPELVHNETRLLNNAGILAEVLELDMMRVLAFTYAYACLNASWWTHLKHMENADDIVQWHLKVARIIEPHIEVCF
jgi:streptomycin 6-kinase